jgi:hypothetical protein
VGSHSSTLFNMCLYFLSWDLGEWEGCFVFEKWNFPIVV